MTAVYWLYAFTLGALSLYSFALTDPNFTLFNHPVWTAFRNNLIYLGYYRRDLSTVCFLILVGLLVCFNYYFIKKSAKVNFWRLSLIVGSILFLSYPFLSHDFFNYLFDAKILTFYHKNPYQFSALDFPSDHWSRFMHWTHRTYPYGPVFLLFSLLPSFLSFGKFILSFYFFKLLFIGFFIYSLNKISKVSKKWSIFLLTSPLIIIEGFINLHNDWLALSLGLLGIYYLTKQKKAWGIILLFLSTGIKYLSAPVLALSVKRPAARWIALLGFLIVLGYLSFFQEIQPWYFLNLFLLLPYFEKLILKLKFFFLGLLLSYYPYVFQGEWDKQKLLLKHQIIISFFILNIIYLIFVYLRKPLFSKK